MEAIERMAALCMRDPGEEEEEEEGDDEDPEGEEELMVGTEGVCGSFWGQPTPKRGCRAEEWLTSRPRLQAELQEVLGDGGGGSESPDPPTQVWGWEGWGGPGRS